MDEDIDYVRGTHVQVSAARRRAALQLGGVRPELIKQGRKSLWGCVFQRRPPKGEHYITIVDEVRVTTLLLTIIGVSCACGFLIADLGLNRISVRDVYAEGGHGLSVLIGGIFSLLATILSFIQIRAHYNHWTHPPSQKLVVRILLMVPIYATCAWGGLTFLSLSSYIDFARGCYEAFVIYTFMILLTKYLGGHSGVVEWMKYKPKQSWPSPLCCLSPVVPDSKYLYYLKYGALQYTIITPICSLTAVVLTTFGTYSDGVIAVNNGYPYLAFVINSSQVLSLYCLVWLYVCVKNELAPFGPMPKFLVVKAVVFATFWQGFGLAVMAHLGWITNTDNFSVGEVQIGLQNFLICIEMFIAACAHKYTFGAETYADGSLRVLMEQRSLYLAEQSYRRGVDQQRAAQKLADELAAAANPGGKVTTVHVEETPEEEAQRQADMALVIKRAIDDDSEGSAIFDEDTVDWSTGALPRASFLAASGQDGMRNATSAFDYVYEYELEQQRSEGFGDQRPAPLSAAAKRALVEVPMSDDIGFGVVDEGNENESNEIEMVQQLTPTSLSSQQESEIVDVDDDGDEEYDESASSSSFAVNDDAYDRDWVEPSSPSKHASAAAHKHAVVSTYDDAELWSDEHDVALPVAKSSKATTKSSSSSSAAAPYQSIANHNSAHQSKPVPSSSKGAKNGKISNQHQHVALDVDESNPFDFE